MADWLKDYLGTVKIGETMESFAERLAASLNSVIPASVRQSYISGFHVAGFTSCGMPEFWYIRNVDDDRQTIFGEYRVREEFHRAHARALPVGGYQIYRNGDIRAHVLAWQEIDKSLGVLRLAPDFHAFTTPEDFASWLKFKMEIVVMLYERYCTHSIIGGPVDVFAISGMNRRIA